MRRADPPSAGTSRSASDRCAAPPATEQFPVARDAGRRGYPIHASVGPGRHETRRLARPLIELPHTS
jgi:hypothetical protein